MKPKATVYWLYCIINQLYGKNAKLSIDPLGRQYSVNRYGIRVEVNQKDTKTVCLDITKKLEEAEYYPKQENQYHIQYEANHVYISLSHSIHTNHVYIHVMAYARKKEPEVLIE
jgi:hypothetical protein